jgi:hypothetical protein
MLSRRGNRADSLAGRSRSIYAARRADGDDQGRRDWLGNCGASIERLTGSLFRWFPGRNTHHPVIPGARRRRAGRGPGNRCRWKVCEISTAAARLGEVTKPPHPESLPPARSGVLREAEPRRTHCQPSPQKFRPWVPAASLKSAQGAAVCSHTSGRGQTASPTVSAMVAPRSPNGFSMPTVESCAV